MLVREMWTGWRNGGFGSLGAEVDARGRCWVRMVNSRNMHMEELDK